MKSLSLFIFSFRNVKFKPRDPDLILGGGLYQHSTVLKGWLNMQQLSIGYIPTYSLVFNISQTTNFDIITMVLEFKKVMELSKVL